MYKEFFIYKQSGTYSETLEAFGLGVLLNEILKRLEVPNRKIVIEDLGFQFKINSSHEISEEMLEKLSYFQIIKFIINKADAPIPEGLSKTDCFDYVTQKNELDFYKTEYESIDKSKVLNSEKKKTAKQELSRQKHSEFGLKIDAEFDVYREITRNPYPSFLKIYQNFHQNKDTFSVLIKEFLNYYSGLPFGKHSFRLEESKPTAQQLFNPNQGNGLNKPKANNATMGNLNSNWISETLKISGALSIMSIQYVKVGSGYDLKIYVPDFKNIQLNEGLKLITEFKRNLKSVSPIKLDILNIIDFIIKFIELTPEYKKGKVKNTISGFHSVYQKDLGQNKAVANIAFINTPDFIEYSSRLEGREWIEILRDQRNVISSLEELGETIHGLQNYRNFIGSTGETALRYFSNFCYWYSSYLIQSLDKEKFYVKPFQIETLNKFYTNMNTNELNLTSIFENEGFKAVASAIRKRTVILQYTPKENRKFEIRYGLAQQLQNKSKSKEDLATFIGELIGTYNSETARNAEKNGGKPFRANVKDEELIMFFKLLDSYQPRLIGALLASYGFALNKKEAPKNEDSLDKDSTENEN